MKSDMAYTMSIQRTITSSNKAQRETGQNGEIERHSAKISSWKAEANQTGRKIFRLIIGYLVEAGKKSGWQIGAVEPVRSHGTVSFPTPKGSEKWRMVQKRREIEDLPLQIKTDK